MYVDIPASLRRADFSRIEFHLEFQEPFPAAAETVLRLRRELRRAGREALDEDRFGRLFDPALPVDPLALRQVQRPAPPFVVQLPESLPGLIEAGDCLGLPVVFWGDGRQYLDDFTSVLESLGRIGICRGEGRFEVAEVEALDAAGRRHSLRRPGRPAAHLPPPALDAGWFLETALPAGEPVRLEFITPARLLSGGRPLFRPSFTDLFPFVLRRVTSMLQTCCRLETTGEPRFLVRRAAAVRVVENRLGWQDWRRLQQGEGGVDLGGVGGHLLLAGDALGELLWVLGLGTLMNLGKGASFGAGEYRLESG